MVLLHVFFKYFYISPIKMVHLCGVVFFIISRRVIPPGLLVAPVTEGLWVHMFTRVGEVGEY